MIARLTLMLFAALSGCAQLDAEDFAGTWMFGTDAAVSGACDGTPITNALAGQQKVFIADAASLVLVQPTCDLRYVVTGTRAVLLPNQQCPGQGAARSYELHDAFELNGDDLTETISGTVVFADRVCTGIRGGGTLTRL